MIGELPELDDFFSKKDKENNNEELNLNSVENEKTIYIYISKEEDKWILADFISIAVAGIGVHLSLPIDIELTVEEINNIKIRFVKKSNSHEEILKEIKGFVRWQDRDPLTGRIKIGLHFPVEYKNDAILIDILKDIENQ
ncbi:MAG TPA: hypothetical protein PLE45_10270 [Spirochaetota bacterium]|nr:hypothetical protein [Spirochaetota bacterium]HOL57601.1 hypothetical protein [Spirochaetota bacterium]HPP05098.1 hypothetical protein [Spirochaetota bacterium]